MRKEYDKKLMVFESCPDFSDNSRGFWEYVVKNTDYKTYWVIRDEEVYEELKKQGVVCGLDNSEEASQMIEKAQFLISSTFDFAVQKNVGQVHVSAWHGFPLKVIGFFDSASSEEDTFDSLKVITTQTDIITATSRFSRLTLSGMFAVDPRKVKETGYPRTDIMFWSDAKKELSKLLPIDVYNSKLFFYLPTMRKGLKGEGEQFDDNIFNYLDYDADEIDWFLEKNNAYIVAKVHFADAKKYKSGDFKLPERLIFLDNQELERHFCTIYHIMNAFDGLITDYSSVYVDYMLLDKPIIFSCPDIEKYKNDRGFVVDDPTLLMPGIMIKTQKGLLENLDKILKGEDEYKSIRQEKIPFFHGHVDGDSSKRLLQEMEKLAGADEIDSGKKLAHLFQRADNPLSQYAISDIEAEIFFDVGEGFSEKNKMIKKYDLVKGNDEKVVFEIELPEKTRNIRFDPDHIGRVRIRSLSIWEDNHRISDYQIVNGSRVKHEIIFEKEDPQIIISLGDKEVKKIRIEFICNDLYCTSGNIINEMNEKMQQVKRENSELRRVLNEICTSTSWKVTKPLRIINGYIKKNKGDKSC